MNMQLLSPEAKQSIFLLMRKVLFRPLPDRQFVMLHYLIAKRRRLPLNNPTTFCEKLQWLKLYGGLDRYCKYVDKYEVRDFIKETIGEEYLIPLIGVWDRVEDVPFHTLPEQFVLKATHGCDYNIICRDKAQFDTGTAKKTLKKWLNESYYLMTRENQYKYIRPRIVCEQYLQDESGELRDFKIHCFNGKPEVIQVDTTRYSGHKQDEMDMNWNRLPFTFVVPHCDEVVEKPSTFDEMVQVAETLSTVAPFTRVDLYSVFGKVYFGELTFLPAGGLANAMCREHDEYMGKYLNLEDYGFSRRATPTAATK